MKDWGESDILLMLELNNEYILQHYCYPKSNPLLTIFLYQGMHFSVALQIFYKLTLSTCTGHIFKIILHRIFLEQF